MADSDLITEGRQKLATAAPDQVRRVLADGAGPAQRALHVGFGTSELILWALANLDALLDELESARGWARHGYEVGQRSATWSDDGVAPAWLTEGHRPEALDPTAAMRLRMEVDMENVRLKDAMRDVRRILTDLGVVNLPPRLAAVLKHPAEGSEDRR